MSKLTNVITIGMMIGAVAGCKSTTAVTQELAFNEQSEMRPKSEIAKINAQLGIAYLEQKNVQRAKQKLLIALEQGPGIPETWYSMAYFLEATGNKAEARKYYMKSVAIAPQRGDAQNNFGTFLCRSGEYRESIKHFMLAVKAPDYLDPAAAYENAGQCSMKMHAYKQAANDFNQALLKDPARTSSLLKLAEADVKLGNYSHAREMLLQYSLVSPPTTKSKNLNDQLVKMSG